MTTSIPTRARTSDNHRSTHLHDPSRKPESASPPGSTVRISHSPIARISMIHRARCTHDPEAHTRMLRTARCTHDPEAHTHPLRTARCTHDPEAPPACSAERERSRFPSTNLLLVHNARLHRSGAHGPRHKPEGPNARAPQHPPLIAKRKPPRFRNTNDPLSAERKSSRFPSATHPCSKERAPDPIAFPSATHPCSKERAPDPMSHSK